MKYHLQSIRGSGGDSCHPIDDALWDSDELKKWLKTAKKGKAAPMPPGRELGLESRKGVDTGNKFGEGHTDSTTSLTAVGEIGRGVGEGSGGEETFDPEIIRLAKNMGVVFRHPKLMSLVAST
jgi:hypothetical protein